MKLVLPIAIALAACAPKHPVVMWSSSGRNGTEYIQIRASGEGSYRSTVNGAQDQDQRVVLSSDQVQELGELFRDKGACKLTHDPAYTPAPDEGQTTLELAFPDQRCKVVLWTLEWRRGSARDIAETMQSMRPLKSNGPRVPIPSHAR